ncbi:MAG: hypothetical protein ABIQ53_03595 [Terracoccus sp.]
MPSSARAYAAPSASTSAAAAATWLCALPSSHDLVLGGRPVRFFHASNVNGFHRVHHHHTDEPFAAMFTNTDFTGDGPALHVVGYGDIHGVYLRSTWAARCSTRARSATRSMLPTPRTSSSRATPGPRPARRC